LENTLEQEQEALVNRLWKRMDKLEAEKRSVLFCCQYNTATAHLRNKHYLVTENMVKPL